MWENRRGSTDVWEERSESKDVSRKKERVEMCERSGEGEGQEEIGAGPGRRQTFSFPY